MVGSWRRSTRCRRPTAQPPPSSGAALANNVDLDQSYFDELGGGGTRRPGSFRAGRSLDSGQWVGVIGPVTGRSCVFQDQRRLVCVDALSGEVQWSRTDVPPGCDLFGDDEIVFAAPKGATEARMFDATDGRSLGTTKTPPWEEQLATLGHRVIRWSRGEANRRELSSVDLPSGFVQWRFDFEPGSGVDIDQGRYVAVVEPTGCAVIIDAEDGRALVDQNIPRQPLLEELHLMVDNEGFLLAADRRARQPNDRMVRPFDPLDSAVITGQLFYFETRHGPATLESASRRPGAGAIGESAAGLAVHRVCRHVGNPQARPAGRRRQRGAVGATMLILDKATGRTLYSDDALPAASTGLCLARVRDAAGHEAAIEMGARTVVLRFTEGRRPPEPPAMAEVESSASRTSGGLLGIIRNLGEGARR